MKTKVLDLVYFQPKGINPKYCEVGCFLGDDKDYIYYLHEPCKIHILGVKIIDAENVEYNKKLDSYIIKNQL